MGRENQNHTNATKVILVEIERKFLLDAIPFDLSKFEHIDIEQAYISVDPVIRLRRADDDFFLTVKQGFDMAHEEAEFVITQEQYDRLLRKAETKSIKKTRVRIPIVEGHIAELDIYHDSLAGFATVEVEFKNVENAREFMPPVWFGQEVTGDLRYANSAIATFGLQIH
ncbi:MAG: CYTH domain-containing protein [Clostridiales bacterium]|jgi:CYTH domain-containing protein|nr:CYTH domain-containing protein [Clostridiales bacterium]